MRHIIRQRVFLSLGPTTIEAAPRTALRTNTDINFITIDMIGPAMWARHWPSVALIVPQVPAAASPIFT